MPFLLNLYTCTLKIETADLLEKQALKQNSAVQV